MSRAKITVVALEPVALRVSEIERLYGIKKGTLNNLFKAGLPSIKVGGRAGHRGSRIVLRKDLDAFLATRREVVAR